LAKGCVLAQAGQYRCNLLSATGKASRLPMAGR
jgi:hypothetical protein